MDTVTARPELSDTPIKMAATRQLSFSHRRNVIDSKQDLLMLKRVFGIGMRSHDMPASKLIYPGSSFSLVWTILTALLLVYTAICTPAVVSFYWKAGLCDAQPPTAYFDLFVDCFFIFDIVITCGTGVHIDGRYEDRFGPVLRAYLRHGLFFDLATSLPVSFIELSARSACDDHSEHRPLVLEAHHDMQLRLIRMVIAC
jgi:hypothetical protein